MILAFFIVDISTLILKMYLFNIYEFSSVAFNIIRLAPSLFISNEVWRMILFLERVDLPKKTW